MSEEVCENCKWGMLHDSVYYCMYAPPMAYFSEGRMLSASPCTVKHFFCSKFKKGSHGTEV